MTPASDRRRRPSDLTPVPLSRRSFLRGLTGAALAGAAAVPLTGCDGGDREEPEPRRTSAGWLGLRFPEGFAWGAATSAYQVEGATREDGRGESIWDRFARTPGAVANGDTGDTAADHYHRYRGDLDLMLSLGLRSYRFSVAWPRVLPDGRGPVNQRGLDFYRRLVDGLHARGIAPIVTLFHWDLPQPLQDAGGWENRDCAQWFADYAAIMFRALGDAVPTWLTVNEPKVVVRLGYTLGIHAPGKKDEQSGLVAGHHLLLGSGLAVQALRASGGGARIGPTLNLNPVYPADESPDAARAATLADGWENRWYLDPVLKGRYPADVLDTVLPGAPLRSAIRDGDLDTIATPVDLLGVQYYNPFWVTGSGEHVPKRPTTMASWQQVFPQGLYDVLTRVRRDYGDVRLVVTENGMPRADRLIAGAVDDTERITFLRDHLAAAHRAIQQGVRVDGYHVWSLLDNFEWAEGYTQRWGLVYVDYPTQRRVPKASARWYRDVIRRNGT